MKHLLLKSKMNNIKVGNVLNFHSDILVMLCLTIIGVACGVGGESVDGENLIKNPSYYDKKSVLTNANGSLFLTNEF